MRLEEGRVTLKIGANSLGANRMRRLAGPIGEGIKVPFTIGPLKGHAICTGFPRMEMGTLLTVSMDLALVLEENPDLTLAQVLKEFIPGLEFS